ncbi:MAG: hypothetical protein HKN87_22845, partial [Saprospiraceae bacterium]|nr:hypothetical protein [Saprospiraceae bacterium]
MKKLLRYFSFFCLACSAPLVMSQEGILSGVVTDGGLNEPLAFANVLIGEVNLGST